jgi:hypothetical protein
MAKKAFLLRIDEAVFDAVKRLADADLRSVNAEVEYLLREALRRRGQATPPGKDDETVAE